MIVPIFLLLVFGVIEWSYALHGRMSVANMALTGARTGSGHGRDLMADYHLLRAVRAGAGGLSPSDIDTVVVYRAVSPASEVPPGCKTSSLAGVCNRYQGADLEKDTADFGCLGPPAKIDSSWCPTTRKTSLTGTAGPPDYIGVYVEASHRNLTGLFGPELTFRSDTIIRIEPRTLS